MNKPPTLESEFYLECKKKGLLPKPLFKCITNNRMLLQGKRVGTGYASALAKLISHNDDPLRHVLYLQLDDCNLGDNDFSLILEALQNTQHFEPTIQSIAYSNNELGPRSVASFSKLLSRNKNYESDNFIGLSEIKLNNV